VYRCSKEKGHSHDATLFGHGVPGIDLYRASGANNLQIQGKEDVKEMNALSLSLETRSARLRSDWPWHVLRWPASGGLCWGWHWIASPLPHLHLGPLWPPGAHKNTIHVPVGSTVWTFLFSWSSFCACEYHDFVCVPLLSVIKGQVSSVVQSQLHPLWRPCCPQHPEAQSAGQLARCYTHLLVEENIGFQKTVHLCGDTVVIPL